MMIKFMATWETRTQPVRTWMNNKKNENTND